MIDRACMRTVSDRLIINDLHSAGCTIKVAQAPQEIHLFTYRNILDSSSLKQPSYPVTYHKYIVVVERNVTTVMPSFNTRPHLIPTIVRLFMSLPASGDCTLACKPALYFRGQRSWAISTLLVSTNKNYCAL